MRGIRVDSEVLPAVFVDLDGTVLNDDGLVDEASALLLEFLSKRKIRVIVATARSPQGALEAINGLSFDPICICLNGALVVDLRSDRIIYESTLPNSNFKQIISAIEEESLGTHYLALQHRNSFIIEEGFMDNANFEIPHIVGEVRNYSEAVSKLILRTDTHTSSELHDIFAGQLSLHSFLSTSGDDWLDFSPAEVSKATGAHQAARHYDIDITKCAAVGNDLNDLELLRSVGFGFAVTNARSRLLADHSILKLHSDNNSRPLFEVVMRCADEG